jgi:ABC-2 type transport system permease protein
VAAHVLRLRLALLWGALRGTPAHTVRVAVGIVLVVAAVAASCAALLWVARSDVATLLVVTVTGGAAITAGFVIAPVISGASDPLDPRRFALFNPSPRGLAASTLLAGLISVPVLSVLALAICAAILWTNAGAPAIVAVVSVVLGVLTCVLLARVFLALTAMLLRGRPAELTGVFVIGLLVVVLPVGVFLSSLEWDGEVPVPLQIAVMVIALTPFGAAWALPGLVAAGDPLAWLATVVAVVTVAGLALAWFAIVGRMLSSLERPVSARERGGLGWFAVTPGNAGGAIAARSLVYWLRDRRYIVNVVVVPIAAVLTAVPLLIAGVPAEYAVLVPVPIMALFLGWLPHNDLAYDSTAVWMHVASGVRGAADRVGRLVPILVIGIPLIAIGIPIAIALNGRWALAPALTGVCACLFLAALGLSSIASAAAPYAVSRPGDSPFQQPQRSGASGIGGQAAVMVGAVVVTLPVLWWGWLAMTDAAWFGVLALGGGLAIGLVVLIVGVAIGSVVFERRSSDLMEFAAIG